MDVITELWVILFLIFLCYEKVDTGALKKKNYVGFCNFACLNSSSLTWNLCSSESSRISCACFRSNHWSSRRGVFKDIMTLYHSFCEAYKNNFLSVSNRIRVLYLYYHSVWKSQKSLIQYCERSELRLHLSGQKFIKNAKKKSILASFWKPEGQL